MTSFVLAEWTVIPSAAPQPVRHCPGCRQSRNFASSGRIRLNSNGKRLDPWLIYKCMHCDQTWNRPIIERRPVGQIAGADLEAMQQSSPEWVERHEFDAAALKAQCSQVYYETDLTIFKEAKGDVPEDWSQIRLRVSSQAPTGLRLERILCEGWQISRSSLQRLKSNGNLVFQPNSKNVLRKPLHRDVTVALSAAGLGCEMRVTLLRGLGGWRDS